MKKLSLIIFVLIFTACNQNADKVRIIENYDLNFMNDQQVDEAPGTKKQIDKVINDLKDIAIDKSKGSKEAVDIIFNFRLYVNADGTVYGIKELPIEERHDKKEKTKIISSASLMKDIAAYAAKWNFTPAQKNNESVKYRGNIEVEFSIDKDGNVKERMPALSGFDKAIRVMGRIISGEKINKDDYKITVDEMPSIKGGMQSLVQNVIYPEEAKKEGLEGKVFVKAFVDQKGDVISAEVIKGVEGLNKAALNAVMKTKFIPGKENGKTVKVQISIPIVFRLK